MGLMKAAGRILKVENKGCFFHFTQAIWRKVKELGLYQTQYKDATRCLTLKIFLLVFVHLDVVEKDFKEKIKNKILDKAFEPFFEYFEKTWIKLYPPKLWNYSTSTHEDAGLQRMKRTNNILESFHNYLAHKTRGVSNLMTIILIQCQIRLKNLGCMNFSITCEIMK
jgi:hypothetical protein